MILLESHNVIIQNTLSEKFIKPSSVDISFVDYDGVRFRMHTPEKKTGLILSMSVRCWDELAKYGADEIMKREYGARIAAQPEPQFNVTLEFDLENVPAPGEEREALIKSVSLIKRNALAAPFEHAFKTQKSLDQSYTPDNQKMGDLMAVHYRDEEAIYIQASHDRVTVVFSTVFKEETDRVIGKIFLQEFVDARRLQSLQTAPQVLYSAKDPPLEIRNVPGLINSDDVGYVTFVIFPRHFAHPDQASSTISHIQLFRDYLHYHIKCSKAYLHSRMRTRVQEFLKVLNRAKEVREDKKVERKTITGRTMTSR